LVGLALRESTLFFAAAFDLEDEALALGALLALFFVDLALDETVTFDFVALRAGAFSALERLTIGFGRGDLPAAVRFLAVDAEEV
jgi:hypothetical protein